MDFPEDLKLSPVGAAPPLPSTPPIPPARTRSSRRLPQVPLPETRPPSRPNSKPIESWANSEAIKSLADSKSIESRLNSKANESLPISKAIESRANSKAIESWTNSKAIESQANSKVIESRANSKVIEFRANSKTIESQAVSRPTIAKKPSFEMPVAAKRQQGKKNLGEGSNTRSVVHSKPPHSSRSDLRPSIIEKEVSPPNDIFSHGTVPNPVCGDSSSRESISTSISMSKQSPTYALFRSRESPTQALPNQSDNPSKRFSNSKENNEPSELRVSVLPIESSYNQSLTNGLSIPNSCTHVNSKGDISSVKVSPSNTLSRPSIQSQEGETSAQSSPVHGNSSACTYPPCQVSRQTSPVGPQISCESSPVIPRISCESSLVDPKVSDKSSPVGRRLSGESSPLGLRVSGKSSPVCQKVSGESSPDGRRVSGESSPVGRSVFGKSSLVGRRVSGEFFPVGQKVPSESSPVGHKVPLESSPVCQRVSGESSPVGPRVSCESSPSGSRMSVKCLAENCEQISSYVSHLVISETKSNNVIHDSSSQVKTTNVQQIVISDKNKCEPKAAADNTSIEMMPKITSPTKPVLKKADAIDIAGIEEKKKMERGISHATGNEPLVLAARNVVQQDFQVTIPGQTDQKDSPVGQPGFIETPLYTFTLPDLTNFPEDFRGFLEKDLIELSALISLENAGRLNWWADTGTCQRLWPLATTGDGNCLLHAASLGMWGFHDRLLTLRKALFSFLTSSEAVGALYRRWRWQASQQNLQSGLSLTEAEWAEEWSSVLRLASTEPRPPPEQLPKRRSRLSTVSMEGLDVDYHQLMYESLEEVHVLVLAHVLRRPIIIVADTILKDAYGEALAPIPFGGIYLPLEVSPSECHKCPLLLTYDAGHFSALVGMQSAVNVRSPLPTVIPLTDSNHSVLPIQFCVDPGDELNWGQDETNPHVVSKLTLQHQDQIGLLKEFLEVLQVPLPACFLDPPPDPDPTSPDSPDPCQACAIEAEISSRSSDETNTLASKSKTAKQIQSVAKQFGSIGKTVSKKLKKNLGTITKLARNGSFKGLRRDVRAVSQTTRLQSSRIVAGHQDYILTAVIHTNKCLPYHQEMVANYLEEAKLRFDKDKELKILQAEERRRREEERLENVALAEGPVQCINPDCQMMGSALSSYLCSYCYYHQMRHETDAVDSPHGVTLPTEALYGSGKSKFYVNADESSYETLRNIPVAKHATLRNNDRSIYLANSTFYRDTTPSSTFQRDSVPLVVPVSANDPDPPPIVAVDPPQHRNISRKKWLVSSNNAVIVNGEVCCSKDAADQVNGAITVQLPNLSDSHPCQSKGCSFFGTSETNYFCSKCFKESQRCLLINQASQV